MNWQVVVIMIIIIIITALLPFYDRFSKWDGWTLKRWNKILSSYLGSGGRTLISWTGKIRTFTRSLCPTDSSGSLPMVMTMVVVTFFLQMQVAPPGRISYSQRLTITGRCAMDLRKFPLDTQVLNIIYLYTCDQILLYSIWYSSDQKLQMAFQIVFSCAR